MSEYITRRNKVAAEFALDHGVSEIDAGRLVTEWEYEANRRGLDQRQTDFWRVGRTWMAEELGKRRPVVRD